MTMNPKQKFKEDNTVAEKMSQEKYNETVSKLAYAIVADTLSKEADLKETAKKVGDSIKDTAGKVGKGVSDAAKKVGDFTKDTAGKVSEGAKGAAGKVGDFVEDVQGKHPDTGGIGDKIDEAKKFYPDGIRTGFQRTYSKSNPNFARNVALTAGIPVAAAGLAYGGKKLYDHIKAKKDNEEKAAEYFDYLMAKSAAESESDESVQITAEDIANRAAGLIEEAQMAKQAAAEAYQEAQLLKDAAELALERIGYTLE